MSRLGTALAHSKFLLILLQAQHVSFNLSSISVVVVENALLLEEALDRELELELGSDLAIDLTLSTVLFVDW